jgi:hypothetical protein
MTPSFPRRRESSLIFAIVLASILVAAAAQALELETPVTDSVSIIETLTVIHDVTNPGEPFWALVNWLNLQVAKGPFTAGIRYDTEAYLLNETYAGRYLPQKYFVQYDQKPFFVRVGDFYARFGNGLTLSMLKIDAFGIDATIQGAVFRTMLDYFEVEALGGPVNYEDDSSFTPARVVPQPSFWDGRDLLWGARLMAGPPKYIRVGGTWVGGVLRDHTEGALARFSRDNTFNMYSAIIEAPHLGPAGSIEGEYAWLDYDNAHKNGVPDEKYEGHGTYLLSTWYPGPVTLTVEGIDYFKFALTSASGTTATSALANPVQYNLPPSLEYTDMAFGHPPNYDDSTGGRARLDYTIPGIDLASFVNYTRIESHKFPVDLVGEHYGATAANPRVKWIEHLYGGFDRNFGNGAQVVINGGYREIEEGRYIHGQVQGATPIVYPHSLNAETQAKQFQGMGDNSSSRYYDQDSTIGYAYAPYFSVSGEYEWSNQPAGGVITVGAAKQNQPNFWSVQTVVQPANWARLTLGYGRYQGGLQCSGGVCRIMPPFTGFKSQYAFRF